VGTTSGDGAGVGRAACGPEDGRLNRSAPGKVITEGGGVGRGLGAGVCWAITGGTTATNAAAASSRCTPGFPNLTCMLLSAKAEPWMHGYANATIRSPRAIAPRKAVA
jgi:hypothetical protein